MIGGIGLAPRPVPIPKDGGPFLHVVIDTEEERDWSEGYRRDQFSVAAIEDVDRAQCIFDEFGVRPTYVVDYPIASQKQAYVPLRQIAAGGRALIGAHLHPWVNPPYSEELTRSNSFPGNLPRAIEASKLGRLADTIEQNFGARPRIYKAGRYGIGPRTPEILGELGFDIDLSADPAFDYSHQGGPDFRGLVPRPFCYENYHDLLCIPNTGAFVGFLSKHFRLHQFAAKPLLQRLKLQGILSRLRVIDRLRLSPEYYRLNEMIQLTRWLLSKGVRTFTLSFHSPTLRPMCSPYVKTEAELQAFLGTLRGYLRFFLEELGGSARTTYEIEEWIKGKRTPAESGRGAVA